MCCESNEIIGGILFHRFVFHIFHIASFTWCGAIRSEWVNQRCLYHVLLICLAVSRNTHMSVFISVPSQAPLEGQVIAFWLYLFPSAFHFRYLLREILPGNILLHRCCQNLTDWSLNKYIKVSLLLCCEEMQLLYWGRKDQLSILTLSIAFKAIDMFVTVFHNLTDWL